MNKVRTPIQLIVFLSFFLLSACGSGEKKESSVEEPEITLDDGPISSGSADSFGELEDSESLEKSKVSNLESPTLNGQFIRDLKTVKKTSSTGEATRAIATVLSEEPDNIVALNTLSMHYYKMGRLGMAKTILDRAFEKEKKNSSLYNSLGIIRLREGDLKESILAFSEALRIDPGNVYAAKNLGAIYAEYHDYDKAMPLLRKAFKAFPKDEGVANNYAVSLRATGKPDLARKIYQAWDGKMKEAISLYNYAALLLNDVGDSREALLVIGKISKSQLSSSLVTRLKIMEQRARSGIK